MIDFVICFSLGKGETKLVVIPSKEKGEKKRKKKKKEKEKKKEQICRGVIY